jgi:hypothetical protein
MKLLKCLVLVALLCSVGMAKNIEAPLASVTPTIDGFLDAGEWDDAAKIVLDHDDLFTGPAKPDAFHPDYSAEWSIKWDMDYLYFACSVTGDIHVCPDLDPGDGVNKGDCAQIVFGLLQNSDAWDWVEVAPWDNHGASDEYIVVGKPDIHNHTGNVILDNALSDGSRGCWNTPWSVEFAIAWADQLTPRGTPYVPVECDVHSLNLINPDIEGQYGWTEGAVGVGKDHYAWEHTWIPTGTLHLIPEPATIALLGLGGLALLRKKR